jgi:hypothetical protein
VPPVFDEAFTIEVTPALKLLEEALPPPPPLLLLPDEPLLPHADRTVAMATTPPVSASTLRFRMFR